MSLFDHVKSVASITVITLNLLFWVPPILVLSLVKLLVPASRRVTDRALEGCYRLAVAVDDAWLRGVIGIRWDRPFPPVSSDEVSIVLSNHVCWADILVLQSVLCREGPLLKFLTKRELAWIPIFGVIFWAFDFPLLRRTTKEGQSESERRAFR